MMHGENKDKLARKAELQEVGFRRQEKRKNHRQKNSKEFGCLKYFQLDSNSSLKDLRKKYYKLAVKYHPDKAKTSVAQQKFKELSKMYEECKKVLQRSHKS
jgi:preprotein translocase subunit Sec63